MLVISNMEGTARENRKRSRELNPRPTVINERYGDLGKNKVKLKELDDQLEDAKDNQYDWTNAYTKKCILESENIFRKDAREFLENFAGDMMSNPNITEEGKDYFRLLLEFEQRKLTDRINSVDDEISAMTTEIIKVTEEELLENIVKISIERENLKKLIDVAELEFRAQQNEVTS